MYGAHILLVELESNADPRESRLLFEELRYAAAHTTHLFVPGTTSPIRTAY